MKKLNQVENITPLSVVEQTNILGGKHGWLKRLFKRHTEIGDDRGNHSNDSNHDRNDDGHRRRRGRRG